MKSRIYTGFSYLSGPTMRQEAGGQALQSPWLKGWAPKYWIHLFSWRMGSIGFLFFSVSIPSLLLFNNRLVFSGNLSKPPFFIFILIFKKLDDDNQRFRDALLPTNQLKKWNVYEFSKCRHSKCRVKNFLNKNGVFPQVHPSLVKHLPSPKARIFPSLDREYPPWLNKEKIPEGAHGISLKGSRLTFLEGSKNLLKFF